MTEKIRKALEIRLAAMTPSLATAWENTAYTPVQGTPYQRVNMLYANPDNSVLGCQRHRDIGVFQIALCFPINGGNSLAQSRAELVRDWFKRGTVMTNDGQTVLVTRTPSKTTLGVDGERYVVVVSINYSAEIIG